MLSRATLEIFQQNTVGFEVDSETLPVRKVQTFEQLCKHYG